MEPCTLISLGTNPGHKEEIAVAVADSKAGRSPWGYWVASGGVGLLANAGVMLLSRAWHRSIDGGPFLRFSTSEATVGFALDGPAGDMVFVFLLALALAEIPIMLFALRQLDAGNVRQTLITHAANLGFVFFAAVYAFICLLLTSRLDYCLVIASSSLLRLLGTSLWGRPA